MSNSFAWGLLAAALLMLVLRAIDAYHKNRRSVPQGLPVRIFLRHNGRWVPYDRNDNEDIKE